MAWMPSCELPAMRITASWIRETFGAPPEAAVVDQGGTLRYHGRIDDRWVSLGRDRSSPTHSDLAEALSATLAGHLVAQAGPPAVGCILSDFLR